MPSKATFALLAALAATAVSAVPVGGYGGNALYARDGALNPSPPAQAQAPAPVGQAPAPVGQVSTQTTANPPVVDAAVTESKPKPKDASTHPHRHPRRRRSSRHHSLDMTEPTTEVHPNHPHPHRRHTHLGAVHTDATTQPLTNPAAVSGVTTTGTTASQTLRRREYYENLVARDGDDVPPTHHSHHSHSFHPHPITRRGTWHAGDHHHLGHEHHKHLAQPTVSTPAQTDASTMPPPPPTDPSLNTREYLEERGILEALGLKARVVDLTVKQTEKMNKAKTVCDGLSSKKDKKKCHSKVDKVIQLTKERNFFVKEFIDETNHHDVFTSSDPSLHSSSTSSTTSTPTQ